MSKPSLDYRLAQKLDLVGDPGFSPVAPFPTRNAPSPLGVFLSFIGQRPTRRQRRRQLETAAPAGDTHITLRADGEWHATGITLEPGDSAALHASGRLFLSRPLEVSISPRTCVWYRIDDGPIARLPAESGTVTATHGGQLRLQATLPGAFGSPNGETSSDNPPPPMSGEIHINISRGAGPQAPALPAGWHYYWRIGEGSIFHECADEGALCCHTQADVGIIKYPIEAALEDTLALNWAWRVDELPSNLPEHVQPTHDYLSIAVEFDNGLDLTYMWSSGLPVGTIFQCPLPWWDKRETHWVLRRPEDGLGQWLDESRSLRADYAAAIGGPLPNKVVAVWLIANSAFQSGRGLCRYRNIQLGDGQKTRTIFGS